MYFTDALHVLVQQCEAASWSDQGSSCDMAASVDVLCFSHTVMVIDMRLQHTVTLNAWLHA